jgi:hypothetical protein
VAAGAAAAPKAAQSPRARASLDRRTAQVAAAASWLQPSEVDELLRQTNGDAAAAIHLASQQMSEAVHTPVRRTRRA